jgi:hypothetical protein
MTYRHTPSLLIAIAAAAFAAAAADTQAQAQAPAVGQSGEDCGDAPSPEAEIACLRQALSESRAALARTGPSVPPATSAPAQSPETAPPANPAPAQPSRPDLPQIAPPRPAAAAELGAEQVAEQQGEDREDEADLVRASVVASERVHPDRLQVELDNGQVWRQIESDSQKIYLGGSDPVAIEMWGSRFGGYRMRLVESGRALKVERVR